MAEKGKVHPECLNAANPYHECFEECYVKMGKANPQMVKSFSGLAGRDPVSRSKNRESSKKKKLQKVTTFPYVSTVEPDHASTIESEKHELDNNNNNNNNNNKAVPPPVPYSGDMHPEEFSLNKGQTKSSQSVPTSGRATPAIANSPERRMNGHVTSIASTPWRKGHKHKHVNLRELLLGAAANEPPQRAKHAPLRSTSSSITFQESDEDDVQSVISESRVSVSKYYMKENMTPILRAILEKYGDIAENCLMESVSMRTCSLECVCLVIQELQSTSFTQLTTLKIEEMLAILKDLENSHIRVDWLRWVLDELSEASEVIARHQQHKSEKARLDGSMEELKKELEVQSEDLRTKEREVKEAKTRVADTRDRIRWGVIESSKLGEDAAALRSQLESFHFDGLINELL